MQDKLRHQQAMAALDQQQSQQQHDAAWGQSQGLMPPDRTGWMSEQDLSRQQGANRFNPGPDVQVPNADLYRQMAEERQRKEAQLAQAAQLMQQAPSQGVSQYTGSANEFQRYTDQAKQARGQAMQGQQPDMPGAWKGPANAPYGPAPAPTAEQQQLRTQAKDRRESDLGFRNQNVQAKAMGGAPIQRPQYDAQQRLGSGQGNQADYMMAFGPEGAAMSPQGLQANMLTAILQAYAQAGEPPNPDVLKLAMGGGLPAPAPPEPATGTPGHTWKDIPALPWNWPDQIANANAGHPSEQPLIIPPPEPVDLPPAKLAELHRQAALGDVMAQEALVTYYRRHPELQPSVWPSSGS
jgi:hypothetical protein